MLLSPLKEETLKDLTEQKPSRGIDFCSSASNRDGNIEKTLYRKSVQRGTKQPQRKEAQL